VPRLREVPHSSAVGLWAVPVRPPTRIVGFMYRRAGVHILTRDSASQPTYADTINVSPAVDFIPRVKSWAFASLPL